MAITDTAIGATTGTTTADPRCVEVGRSRQKGACVMTATGTAATSVATIGTATDVTNAAPIVGGLSTDFPVFLLRELHCAGLRARLLANEIECMATALSGGFVGADVALAHLHETGAMMLIATSSASPWSETLWCST